MKTERVFQNGRIRTMLALLCCLLWGSAFPCVKIGYELLQIQEVGSQILFAGYRFFLAGIFTFLMGCILEKRVLMVKPSNVPVIIRQGILQTTLQYLFFYIGMAHTTGTKGSVINASNAFFSIIGAHFLLKSEKLTWQKFLGCLVGFMGVIAINMDSGGMGNGFQFLGEGMILLCAFFYGISSVVLKIISDRESPMTITSYQLLIGGAILIAVGFLTGGRVTGFTLPSIMLLIYMALLSTVAFSLWTLLLKYNSVGKVTVFGFSIPVFGVLLSAIILGEQIFAFKNLVALVLVIAGILIVNGIITLQERTGKLKKLKG